MADITWADSPEEESAHEPVAQGGGLNMKFLIGGLLILAAVVILVVAGTLTSGRFFITVEELVNRPELVGETVQTSGVVLGDTIKFQEDPMELHFTIAHISDDTAQIEDEGGLAQALHVAASDTSRARVPVVVEGCPCLTCSSTRRRRSSPATWGRTASSTPPTSCSSAPPATTRLCRSRPARPHR
ncbi:MAG: cytochrome c maturation protein CcmE [Anaerolineae bacterium]|nr:cytochrome c maturation protein CcmE [Anaerolineae bacterium]